VKRGTTGATSAPKMAPQPPHAVTAVAAAANGTASCAATTRRMVVRLVPNMVAAKASASSGSHTKNMSRPSAL